MGNHHQSRAKSSNKRSFRARQPSVIHKNTRGVTGANTHNLQQRMGLQGAQALLHENAAQDKPAQVNSSSPPIGMPIRQAKQEKPKAQLQETQPASPQPSAEEKTKTKLPVKGATDLMGKSEQADLSKNETAADKNIPDKNKSQNGEKKDKEKNNETKIEGTQTEETNTEETTKDQNKEQEKKAAEDKAAKEEDKSAQEKAQAENQADKGKKISAKEDNKKTSDSSTSEVSAAANKPQGATGAGGAAGASGGETQVSGNADAAEKEMEAKLDSLSGEVEEDFDPSQADREIKQANAELSNDSPSDNPASSNALSDNASNESTSMQETTSEAATKDVDAAEDSSTLSVSEQRSTTQLLNEPVGSASPTGGGGGGSPIEKPAKPEVPKVAALPPGSALATLGASPPDVVLSGLSGVGGAIAKDVGEQHQALASAPPTIKRPVGANRSKGKGDNKDTQGTAAAAAENLEEVQEGQEVATPASEAIPEMPTSPADQVSTPAVSGDDKGSMTAADVRRVQGSINALPTSDPAMQANAGTSPSVKLEGNADPAQAQEQLTSLQTSKQQAVTEGNADLAQDRGENDTFPEVDANEALVATIPNLAGGGAKQQAAAAAAATEEADAVSVVAHIQKGAEIKASLAQAQGDMAQEKGQYQSSVSAEKAQNQQQIRQAEAENAQEQTKARGQLHEQVQGQRKEWSTEQTAKADKATTESNKAYTDGLKKVGDQQTKADSDAAKHIQEGDSKVQQERNKAEQEAQRQKQKAKAKRDG
ncbi:MAG: hypothetical protein V3T17_02380 [Pseudomonadales bacterium]